MDKDIRVIRNSKDPVGDVCDLETLQNWIKDGSVLPEHQVWDPSLEKWVDAKDFAPVASLFSSSLWDAWEESSSVHFISNLRNDIDSVVEEEVLPPIIHQETTDELIDLTSELEEIVEVSAEDILPVNQVLRNEVPAGVPASRKPPPKIDSPAKVSNTTGFSSSPDILTPQSLFPNGYANRSSHHFTSKEQHFGEQDSGVKIRWVRMSLVVVPAVLLILFISRYVVSVSGEIKPSSQQDLSDNPVRNPVAEANELSESEKQEALLRAKIPEQVMKVGPKSMLEDALYVHFNQMDLNVDIRTAEITKFGGKLGVQPERAIIHIRVTPKDRSNYIFDLAGSVLAIGHYIEHYGLEVNSLVVDIDIGEDRIRTNIDHNLARKFYLNRKTLSQFAEELN